MMSEEYDPENPWSGDCGVVKVIPMMATTLEQPLCNIPMQWRFYASGHEVLVVHPDDPCRRITRVIHRPQLTKTSS
jgi:hypothetical protein